MGLIEQQLERAGLDIPGHEAQLAHDLLNPNHAVTALQLKLDGLPPLPELEDVRLLAQSLDGAVLGIGPGLDIGRLCPDSNASGDAGPADAFLGRLDELLHALILNMCGREGGIDFHFKFAAFLKQRGLNAHLSILHDDALLCDLRELRRGPSNGPVEDVNILGATGLGGSNFNHHGVAVGFSTGRTARWHLQHARLEPITAFPPIIPSKASSNALSFSCTSFPTVPLISSSILLTISCNRSSVNAVAAMG